MKHTHTHTHTHPFNGPLSGTTQVSRYQKGKTNLDFTEARDSEWQYYSISWARLFAICIYRWLAFVQRQSENDCTSLAVLRRNHGSQQQQTSIATGLYSDDNSRCRLGTPRVSNHQMLSAKRSGGLSCVLEASGTPGGSCRGEGTSPLFSAQFRASSLFSPLTYS